MKTIVKIGSFFTAVLIITVTFTSALGYHLSKQSEQNQFTPLFHVRSNQANNNDLQKSLTVNYLGKGKPQVLFTTSQSILDTRIDKAFKLIQNKQGMIQDILERISKTPQIARLFKQYGLSIPQIKQTLAQIRDNPELLQDHLEHFNCPSYILTDDQPLGLDTSSALGCFITVLALLPLALVIGVLIATITIITCFNLGDCFTNLIQAILNGMLQNIEQ